MTIAASRRETVSVFMRGRAFRSRLLLGDAGVAKAGVPVRFGESRVLWVCRIALGPELRYREARGSAQDLCRLFRGSRGGACVGVRSREKVRDVENFTGSARGFLACRDRFLVLAEQQMSFASGSDRPPVP